jgi:hypothetical protein
MKPMVENMDRDLDETLRKRICHSLEIEFVKLSSSSELFVDTTIRKNEFVERCYQHVFLHTIRNKGTTKLIDRTLLSNLAREEFNYVYAKEGHHGVCTPTASKDAIITRAPEAADALRDVSGWEYVDVKKRHGSTLFKEGATQLLYYNQVLTDPLPGVPITSLFMATHIVRVFLLGAAANDGAQPQSGMSDRLPFCNSSPASSRAFDSSDFVLPLYTGRSSPIKRWVPRYYQQNVIAGVRSMAASIDLGSSPISPTNTLEHTTKRPLPASPTDATQKDRNGLKRPRQLTTSTYDRDEFNRPVPGPGSAHSKGLVETPPSATSRTGSSIYSCETDPVIHNVEIEYPILRNPFSDGMHAGVRQNSLNVGNHGRSQYPEVTTPLRYRNKQVTAAPVPRNDTCKKPEEPASVLCSRPNKNTNVVYRVPGYYLTKPKKPTYVLYKSKPKPWVYRTVPCDKHSTNTFATLQKDTYNSTFMYVEQQMEKGVLKEKETYVDMEDLYDTIVLRKLTEVLVGSDSLVSLESKSAIKVS